MFVCQVDLKVDDVRPRMDKNGNIKKNDFIELSMEAKLLDVTERKAPPAETPKEQKKQLTNYTIQTSNCCKKTFSTSIWQQMEFKLLVNFFSAKVKVFSREQTGWRIK